MTDPDAYTHGQHLRSIAEDADSDDEAERLRIAEQAAEDAAHETQLYGEDHE